MMSVMVLDDVTLFLNLKDISNTRKGMQHSPTIGGISSVKEEAEDFKCVSSFFVC